MSRKGALWLKDDDGNVTNVIDVSDVIGVFREECTVQLTFRYSPTLTTQHFMSEDLAKDYANRVAGLMGVPGLDGL